LLLLYPHDRPATITAISLTAVFFNAASGSTALRPPTSNHYRSGLAFAAAALPGSIAGALVVSSVSRSQFDFLMAIVLVALAVWLLIREPGGKRRPRGHLTHRTLTDRYGTTYDADNDHEVARERRNGLVRLGGGFESQASASISRVRR
jgi:uncharacterized protein